MPIDDDVVQASIHAAWQMSRSAVLRVHVTPPWRVVRVLGASVSTAISRLDLSRLPIRAFLLAVAYYVGARVGFAFQAPSAPQSVLWLPNSLLLAALLIARPAHWPGYLIAAFPAQLLVAWQSGEPMAAMSLLFVTNCMDAVLGATAVRAVSRGQWRLDNLRSLYVFLVFGALLAPALISFLDAGITVLTGWGERYWEAYATRLRANSLTNVIVVPAVAATFGVARVIWPRRPARRFGEALALFAGLLVVSAIVFSRAIDGRIAWIYLPIPFLLWAAVRFGPGATGAGLFIVAFVSSWNAVRGVGGFSGQDPVRNIIALQFCLFCVSVPLLSLAMVVVEREAESQKLIASRDEIRRNAAHVRDLAGRLITAQEAERNRIARELHDDVGQYVADLAITMSAMKRVPAVRNAGLEADFQRLYQHTAGLFENVRALSHQLHPSILRHAGLVAATDSLCRAFRQQHDILIEFEAHPVDPIPDEVALCVYRVAQEALRNVAAHSAARRVHVRLAKTGTDLSLTIADDGRGFDVEIGKSRPGLGLVSMEERVRLVHGELSIESGFGGSRIAIRIPVAALS